MPRTINVEPGRETEVNLLTVADRPAPLDDPGVDGWATNMDGRLNFLRGREPIRVRKPDVPARHGRLASAGQAAKRYGMKNHILSPISPRRRLALTGLLATAAITSAHGAGNYSLRGLSVIGDATYLAIHDNGSGRTRLLEVGDQENRAVYVLDWNPETREATIVASGQRMTLPMEQPDIEGLPVTTPPPHFQSRSEPATRHLPRNEAQPAAENRSGRGASVPAVIGRAAPANANPDSAGEPTPGRRNATGGGRARPVGGVVIGGGSGNATAGSSGKTIQVNFTGNGRQNELQATMIDHNGSENNNANGGDASLLTPAERARPRRIIPNVSGDGQTGEE